ncbi:MAG: DUF4105 domain-containing protein [Oligoflexia bacterium]|nr:DUF4105 domain-containing protein [Oligoflexia bacterium]
MKTHLFSFALLGFGLSWIAIQPYGAESSRFGIRIAAENVAQTQRESVSRFAQAASDLLPPSMKEKLGRRIQLRFESLDVKGTLESVCENAESSFIAGYVHSRNRDQIVLNSALLNPIQQGERGAKRLSCKHGDLYRQTLASALHEFAHLYDSEPELSFEERAELQSCPSFQETEVSPRCKYLQSLRSRVSDRREFLSLGDWTSEHILKNTQLRRRLENYETTSPSEYFAVNFEYFLLDPEYQCRRPALNEFLVSHFGYRPFPRRDCGASSRVLLSNPEGKPVALDLDRIYQVHYLIAGPGDDLASRWGHSMLRFVMCGKKRQAVSADCLLDIDDHVVVSFRANVDEFITSHLKGLTGKYPSQVYFLSFLAVLSEYTKKESRDLRSIPLNLSRDQIQRLISKTIEAYWSYAGKYYFVSNNCAAETRDLIGAALEDGHPYRFEIPAVTPNQLFSALSRSGLMDLSRVLHYNGTHKNDLQEAFDSLKARYPMPSSDLDGYLKKSDGQERGRAMRAAAGSKKDLAGFFLLESQVDILNKDAIKRAIARFVEQGGEKGSIAGQLTRRWMSFSEKTGPWNLTPDRRYGVPLEGADPARYQEAVKDLDRLEEEMNQAFAGPLKELFQESGDIDVNLEFLLRKILLER